ncbi:hypothetical protein DFH11DRAFT_1722651 [Phellopilus nigrolimitatus]|nr:hypothetical protein DFH11DRAFT_1722651 [Phellopilus nigrolimitatus]
MLPPAPPLLLPQETTYQQGRDSEAAEVKDILSSSRPETSEFPRFGTEEGGEISRWSVDSDAAGAGPGTAGRRWTWQVRRPQTRSRGSAAAIGDSGAWAHRAESNASSPLVAPAAAADDDSPASTPRASDGRDVGARHAQQPGYAPSRARALEASYASLVRAAAGASAELAAGSGAARSHGRSERAVSAHTVASARSAAPPAVSGAMDSVDAQPASAEAKREAGGSSDPASATNSRLPEYASATSSPLPEYASFLVGGSGERREPG